MTSRTPSSAQDLLRRILWPLRLIWWFISFPIVTIVSILDDLQTFAPRTHKNPQAHLFNNESESQRIKALKAALEDATTFENWQTSARELDEAIPKNYAWKQDRYHPKYSPEDLGAHMTSMADALDENDVDRMTYLLRVALRHNAFGVGNSQLFEQLYGKKPFYARLDRWIEMILK